MNKFFVVIGLLVISVFAIAEPDLGEPERPGSSPLPPVSVPGRVEPSPMPTPAPAPVFTGDPEVDRPPVACRYVPNRPYVYSCRVMANWHTTHWDELYHIENNRKCQKIRQGMYYCSLDFEGYVFNGNR